VCDDLAQAAKTLSYQRALQWELRLFILSNGINPQHLTALHKLPRSGPREQLVPDAEFETVLALASNRLRLAMLLARDAGLRRSAIEKLTNTNVDFDNGEVFGTTKNGARYRVPMTFRVRELMAAVCPFAAKGEPLMAAMSLNRRPIKACTILWELKRTQERSGARMDWSMHDLRRTAARQLYDRTKDIRKVQRLLGHASPIATWWYIGNAGQALSAAELEHTTQPERRLA
jgi:integrase